jgi:hypothetical protein
LPLRLHHVLYVSVVGFMYWSICMPHYLGCYLVLLIMWNGFLGSWSHFGCSRSVISRNGMFISFTFIMGISHLRPSLTDVALKSLMTGSFVLLGTCFWKCWVFYRSHGK